MYSSRKDHREDYWIQALRKEVVLRLCEGYEWAKSWSRTRGPCMARKICIRITAVLKSPGKTKSYGDCQGWDPRLN